MSVPLLHMCSSGRGMPLEGNKTVRVSCSVGHGQANPILALKRTILEMGTVPQKRLFVGEDFVPRPASCLSFLGSQARKVLFSVLIVGLGFLGCFDPVTP